MTTQGSLSSFLYAGFFLTTWVGAVSAFDLETHRKISEAAFTQSTLAKGYLEGELRLSPTMSLIWGTETRTVQEWIAEGSVHEDDQLRPRSHFYDPVRDRGFTSLTCGGQGPAAPDWAFEQATEPVDLRFSWRDARDSFYHSLTDKNLKAGRIEKGREENLARTFRALGDVLHLVQDMGSPEHTRNDAHANSRIDPLRLCGAESLFETRIDRIRDNFTYTGYATPRLQKFRDAWTTGDGRGFAEYTNRNFVSKDTNFTRAVDGNRADDYAQPELNLAFREDVPASDLGIPSPFPVTFFGNFVGDRITGESLPNPRMTTYSLFDRDLKLQDKGLIFALNRFNVEAAAPFLLPRAVGYSAALLDYFFRGKLEARIAPDPADPQRFVLTGTNASQEPLKDGTLKVYGDYESEGRRELGSWTIAGPVVPGGALSDQTLSFRPPTDRPAPDRYMVVYQGSLGEEKKDDPPGFGGAVIGKAAKYAGILEQLFVNPADGDVYFRNGMLVRKLNVLSQLRPGSIVVLRSWGSRNDTFLVEGAVPGEDVSHFYVFTLNRPRPDQVFRDPPVAALVRGPELLDGFFMRSQLPRFADMQILNYLAVLDGNLDVILPGHYCVDLPDWYTADRTECHALLVNHTARTVLLDVSPSALGAPGAGVVDTYVRTSMVLRFDASKPGDSYIVVEGYQHIPADNEARDNDVYRGYLGAVDGNGNVVTALMDWESFQTPYLLEGLLRHRGRHLLWMKSDDNDPARNNTRVYLSSLVNGTSVEIGVGGAGVELVGAASLLPVAPDYLLRSTSPPYFVKGWTGDGAVVLPRADTPGFPPEDQDLASLKRLADLPPGVSISPIHLWQVIEDPDLFR